MQRTWKISLTLLLALAPAGTAHAAGGSAAKGEAAAQSGAATTVATPAAEAEATTNAAASADAAARARFERIRSLGARASQKARTEAESRIDAASQTIEKTVALDGNARVAERFAAEFGTTPEALVAERAELETSWGELVIAHTIQASRTDLTVAELVAMREEMGWGQIAAGLGMKLGDVVSAVRAESRAVNGETTADGRVATIRGGRVSGGASASANARAAGTNVGVGSHATAEVSVPAVKIGKP